MSYDSDVYEDDYGLFNYKCDSCRSISISDTKKGAEELKRSHLVKHHGYREMLIPPEYAKNERNVTVDKALKLERKLRRKLR